MTPKRGYFFALEGIDYAGKWTQLAMAENWFQKTYNQVVVHFSEPSFNTAIGKEIRSYLEHKNRSAMPSVEEFQRLYILDRADDLICGVRHALEKRVAIFAERFAHSSMAYGMLGGLSKDRVIEMHRQIIGSFMIWPDITIILDLPAEVALARLKKDQAVPQWFEKLDKLSKVRKAYLDISNTPDIGYMKVVDANQSPEEIHHVIKKIMLEYVEKTTNNPA